MIAVGFGSRKDNPPVKVPSTRVTTVLPQHCRQREWILDFVLISVWYSQAVTAEADFLQRGWRQSHCYSNVRHKLWLSRAPPTTALLQILVTTVDVFLLSLSNLWKSVCNSHLKMHNTSVVQDAGSKAVDDIRTIVFNFNFSLKPWRQPLHKINFVQVLLSVERTNTYRSNKTLSWDYFGCVLLHAVSYWMSWNKQKVLLMCSEGGSNDLSSKFLTHAFTFLSSSLIVNNLPTTGIFHLSMRCLYYP